MNGAERHSVVSVRFELSYSRGYGRLGETEEQEGEFYGKTGPQQSARHQIQDSVLRPWWGMADGRGEGE